MASVASFSGLASGIQWQDMIDQIMQLEQARRLDPLTDRITEQQRRAQAWTAYQGVVTKLGDAAKALRDGSAFGTFKVTAGTGTDGRALLTASASADAAPGSYRVRVLDLARAEKLSGSVVESTSTPLGLSGEFALNGRNVTITASDTLASLRDKINAANSGANPSRVSASILSTGTGAHRLVLTSDVAGATGIDLADGATHVLGALGLVSDTYAANRTVSGGTATRHLSSMTTAIAAALGVTMPMPSTIRVGDQQITVDLTVDSLAAIAAKIEAAGVPARTVEETVDGRTTYRLEVEATVGTVAGEEVEGQRTLEVLGFSQPTRDAVQQVLTDESAWTASGGAAADGTSALVGLDTPGLETALAAGDTITIAGTDGAGASVLQTFTVGSTSTVDDLLAAIEGAFGGRGVTASVSGGTLSVTDSVGGASKLALSLQVSRAGGDLGNLGRLSTSTTGRLREVVAGSDAVLEVDGVRVTRGGNTIDDVIAGVTLDLQAADAGSEIDVTVARDDGATVAAIEKFADAYNGVASFVKQQTAPGAALAANGTLRSTMAQLTNVLLTGVTGLPAGAAYSRGALVGVALTKTGTLEVDTDALKAALQTNLADVKALFGTNGTTSDAALEYVVGGSATQPGTYDVAITAAATRPALTGSGFGGSYTATGAGDELQVTDGISGKTVTLGLTTGMTSTDIVAALNTQFAADGLRLSAAVAANGTDLEITGTDYGTAATVTVAYAPAVAGTPDPFGLAGTASGTDVAGTIGGRPATGVGQLLTADAGTAADPNPAEGLAVRYLGTAPTGATAPTIAFARGVGGLMAQVTDLLTRSGDGTIASQNASIDSSIASLERRSDDVAARLERRRESLVQQFTAMEAALSRIQAQGNWLTQQLAAMPDWSSDE
ncbi:MAG TPA: flagellar filament capping protein FliD [Gemmatimonadaceae bacterium]|nr:flagellar filament capping protein FliD [Gemmatimonadaceae bacterium]